MVKVIAAMALALCLAQDRPGQDRPGQPDRPGQDRAANQELDQALVKAGQMNNYTAVCNFRKEGGTGGVEGREAGKDLQSLEIRLMPDQPAQLKAGDLELFRKSDVLIYKDGATWKKWEATSMDRSSGRSDQPGGRSEQPGGRSDQPGVQQPGQDRNLILNKIQSIRLPHEFLRDLKSSSFKQIRREDTEGNKVFSGELTDAAIRQLHAGKHRSGDTMSQTATGNAKITLNGEGNIVRYEITLDHKDAGKGAEGRGMEGRGTETMSGKLTKVVEIKDIGSTKYEVPADAKKVFDSKADSKPMDRKDRPTEDKSEEKKSDDKKYD